MQKGAVYSLILHIFILALILIGMPRLFDETLVDNTITVEVVDISELTNIKTSKKIETKEDAEDTSKAPEPKIEETKQETKEEIKKEIIPEPVEKPRRYPMRQENRLMS